MSVTPYGLGSGVKLIPGGQRGFIVERTEKLNGLPSYGVLTERDGRPQYHYPTHNELELLEPGELVGFDLNNPGTGGTGPGVDPPGG